MGPLDSSPQFSKWQDMRPVVQCDESIMTFSASGEGVSHLLVDRGKIMDSVDVAAVFSVNSESK